MKLLISNKKPSVNCELPSLCNFRTSKAYLWSLVRDRLNQLQDKSITPLNILDAACHSLITRDMFPSLSNYFGLDISKTRLANAYKLKRDGDYLFQADLCRPLPIKSFFDVVVSCNTLSHLPYEQQLLALETLLSCVTSGGYLFINATISDKMLNLTGLLLNRFESVEIIYFDSFLSNRDEAAGTVTAHNVRSLMLSNEVNVPNDASIHSQILFCCSNLLNSIYPVSSPVKIGDEIPVLNQLPIIRKKIFDSDELFLSSFSPGSLQWVLLTSKLASSLYGLNLINSLVDVGASVEILTLDTAIPHGKNAVFVLGLEAEWISDESLVRTSLNRLREEDDLMLNLVFVKKRGAIVHTQSFVINDF